MQIMKRKHVVFYEKEKVSSKRWAKPMQNEKITCHRTLEDIQVIHCGNCLKEDDNDTSDTVEWVHWWDLAS